MKLLLVILSILFIQTASVVAQEVQVPIDKDNKVMVIDKELESKLALFPEYSGFVDAKLYKSSDGTYSLEVSYMLDSKLYRKRKSLTQIEVDDLRIQVTECIESTCPVVLLNHEGRTEFLIGTTTLSLGMYAHSIPTMLGIDDASAFIGMYSLIGAAGFFVPYFVTEDIPVTNAAMTLSLYGGAAGLAHGLFLHWVIGSKPEPTGVNEYTGELYYNDDYGPIKEGALSYMTLFSLAELYAGFAIASSTNMSAGKADVITSMGTFGALYGLGIQTMIDTDSDNSAYGLMGLLGSAAGLASGPIIANSQNFTRGDASIFSTSGYLGAWIPSALYLAVATDDVNAETIMGTAVGGSILGLVIGNQLVDGYNFSSSQGSYIAWGTPLGGLLGIGLGIAIDFDSQTIPLIMGAVGSALTFGILYNTFKKKSKDVSALEGLNINVSPIGLTSLFNNDLLTNSKVFIPVVNVSYTF